jgi:hypothetical protein
LLVFAAAPERSNTAAMMVSQSATSKSIPCRLISSACSAAAMSLMIDPRAGDVSMILGIYLPPPIQLAGLVDVPIDPATSALALAADMGESRFGYDC